MHVVVRHVIYVTHLSRWRTSQPSMHCATSHPLFLAACCIWHNKGRIVSLWSRHFTRLCKLVYPWLLRSKQQANVLAGITSHTPWGCCVAAGTLVLCLEPQHVHLYKCSVTTLKMQVVLAHQSWSHVWDHWHIHIKRQFTHQFMNRCTSDDKKPSLLQCLQETHVITTCCSSMHFCKSLQS